jgi:hypothetical protein
LRWFDGPESVLTRVVETGAERALQRRGESADDDEPSPSEENVSAAHLLEKQIRLEVALVDLPARAVAEDAVLP